VTSGLRPHTSGCGRIGVLSASLAALAEMFPYDEIVATLVDQRAVPHDLARAHMLVSERGAY